MIRTSILTTVAVLAFALPAAAKPSHPSGNLRHLLQSYYNDMDEGFAEHDLTMSYEYYSDDFTFFVDATDTSNLDDLKGQTNTLFDAARLIRSSTVIKSIEPQAGGYTVLVDNHMLLKGVSIQTEQMARVDCFFEIRDFWFKTSSGWRLMRSRGISGRGLWNGHEITQEDVNPGGGGDSAPAAPAGPDDSGG